MKAWLKFLILPLTILCLLELIAAIVVGGFLHKEPGSFASIISALIVNFIVGVAIYKMAPIKKLPLSIIYCAVLTISYFYLAIISDGNQAVIFGEHVSDKFNPITEIAKSIGLFLGLGGSYQSEKDELETTSSTSIKE